MAFLNHTAVNQGITSFGTPFLPAVSPVLTNYVKTPKGNDLLHIALTYDRVQQVQEIQHTSPAQSSQGSTLKNEVARGLIKKGIDKGPNTERINSYGHNETIIPYPMTTGREVITEPYLGYDFLRNPDGTLSEAIVKEHSAAIPTTANGQEIRGSFLLGLKQQNLMKLKY